MATYTPGDVLLVDDYGGPTDWLGALIRDGERARGDGGDVWTHSALIVSAGGDIVEALQQGIRRSNISKYDTVRTKVLSLGVSAEDPRRAYAVRYALARLNEGYGVLDFISLAFSLLFRTRLSTHVDGMPICSELCARAVEATTDHGFPYAPERVMPGDLDAVLSGVPPLPPLGFKARLRILLGTTVKAVLGRL
jgi:hypothetical protein